MDVVAEEEGASGGGGGDERGDCCGEVFVMAGFGLEELGLGLGSMSFCLAFPSATASLGGPAGRSHRRWRCCFEFLRLHLRLRGLRSLSVTDLSPPFDIFPLLRVK